MMHLALHISRYSLLSELFVATLVETRSKNGSEGQTLLNRVHDTSTPPSLHRTCAGHVIESCLAWPIKDSWGACSTPHAPGVATGKSHSPGYRDVSGAGKHPPSPPPPGHRPRPPPGKCHPGDVRPRSSSPGSTRDPRRTRTTRACPRTRRHERYQGARV